MENQKEIKRIDEEKMMKEMAVLMGEALQSPEGMRALAAAIAPPISREIETRNITPLLLTQHNLPGAETPKYQVVSGVKAYYVSLNGDVVESPIKVEEIEASIRRAASFPVVDISVLRNGNIGSLLDMQKSSATEIRKLIDGTTLSLISAAVPDDNIVEVSGGELTEDAVGEAMSKVEDKELMVKYLVLRGSHGRVMKGFNLDPQTKRELNQKGIFKIYNGAEIIFSSSMPADEILVIPDQEIGKYPVRLKVTAEPVNRAEQFKTGWVVWTEIGQVITRSDIIAKVKITA